MSSRACSGALACSTGMAQRWGLHTLRGNICWIQCLARRQRAMELPFWGKSGCAVINLWKSGTSIMHLNPATEMCFGRRSCVIVFADKRKLMKVPCLWESGTFIIHLKCRTARLMFSWRAKNDTLRVFLLRAYALDLFSWSGRNCLAQDASCFSGGQFIT